jgi:hypothetical protein
VIPYIAAAIAGALVVARSGPRTKLKKTQCMGPRTGIIYDVDLVPNVGVIIVHAPEGTVGVFQQNVAPKVGFTFVRAIGRADVVDAMKKDLEP